MRRDVQNARGVYLASPCVCQGPTPRWPMACRREGWAYRARSTARWMTAIQLCPTAPASASRSEPSLRFDTDGRFLPCPATCAIVNATSRCVALELEANQHGRWVGYPGFPSAYPEDAAGGQGEPCQATGRTKRDGLLPVTRLKVRQKLSGLEKPSRSAIW